MYCCLPNRKEKNYDIQRKYPQCQIITTASLDNWIFHKMFIPPHNSPFLKTSQIFTQNLRIIFSDLLVKQNFVLLILSKTMISTVVESYYYYVSGLRLLKMILIYSCLLYFVIKCPYLRNNSSSMDFSHIHMHTLNSYSKFLSELHFPKPMNIHSCAYPVTI